MYAQKRISKQSQLVDQNFSNGIMLNTLAALENLAFFYGFRGHKVFNYYSGDARENEASLIDAVLLQLTIFRSSHLNYTYNYTAYDFPKNLSKMQIINYLLKLKDSVPDQSKIFYSEIINYLNGNSNVSGIDNIVNEKKKDWGPTTKEDLQKVSRVSPYINNDMFQQMDNVKNGYNEKDNYEVSARLNDEKGNNSLQNNLRYSEETFVKQMNQKKKIESDIEENFKTIYRIKKENSSVRSEHHSKTKENSSIESELNKLEKNIKLLEQLLGLIEAENEEINSKIRYYKLVIDEFENLRDSKLSQKISELCQIILNIYQNNGKPNYK